MNITICENLKELRKQKGNTQEELAEHLGISMQAVSKWERGEGYPDITLIPAIALYYNVTSDKLLGIDKMNIEAKIQEYLAKQDEIFKQGYKTERVDLWREAQKEFPNNYTVLYQLMGALYWKSNKDALYSEGNEDGNYNEMITIGERLLNECTDNWIRFDTINSLCCAYTKRGDFENARKYADMLPPLVLSQESLYSRIFESERIKFHETENSENEFKNFNRGEAIKHNQSAVRSCVRLVCSFAGYLWISMQKEYSNDEIIKILEFTLNLNKLVYPDGDFDDETEIFYNLYNLAFKNLRIGNTEKALSYIDEMPEHFIKMYINPKFKHTSFLVNKLESEKYQRSKDYIQNEVRNRLKELFEDYEEDNGLLNCIKNDERYLAAMEKMKSLLK